MKTILIERDENGALVLSIEGKRGCHAAGETLGDALRELADAVDLMADQFGKEWPDGD